MIRSASRKSSDVSLTANLRASFPGQRQRRPTSRSGNRTVAIVEIERPAAQATRLPPKRLRPELLPVG
jgi:hypothetical protein